MVAFTRRGRPEKPLTQEEIAQLIVKDTGIDEPEVLQALGLAGEEDMNEEDRELYRQIKAAQTFEEAFSAFEKTQSGTVVEYGAVMKCLGLVNKLDDLWKLADLHARFHPGSLLGQFIIGKMCELYSK